MLIFISLNCYSKETFISFKLLTLQNGKLNVVNVFPAA